MWCATARSKCAAGQKVTERPARWQASRRAQPHRTPRGSRTRQSHQRALSRSAGGCRGGGASVSHQRGSYMKRGIRGPISWGLRRASNGLKHALPARTVKRFGTVNVQVLGVAPRGFTLGEKSLPTAQGTCGRLSAAAGSRARALWALRGAIPAPHGPFVYRSFPLDCPRGILRLGWAGDLLQTCQMAGLDELCKRVPQPLRGVELTAVRGRRRAPPGTNGAPAMHTYI